MKAWIRSVPILAVALSVSACDMFVSVDTRIERATAERAEGDFRAAFIELRNAVKRDSKNEAAQLLLIMTSLDLADPTSALRDIERANAAGVPVEKTAPLLARGLLMLGRHEDLLEQIRSERLKLSEPQRSLFLGKALSASGDLANAEEAFRKALAVDPASVDAQIEVAQLAAARGDIEGATAQVAKLAERGPTADVFLASGLLNLASGNYADADASVERALTGKPPLDTLERATALAAQANARIARNDIPGADKSIASLQQIAPGSPALVLLQGRVSLAKQNYVDAAASFQRALQQDERNTGARFFLAMTLFAQGNTEQAEQHFARVVEEAPENVEARKYLAQARLQQNRPDAAIRALTPALDSKVVDPQVEELLNVASQRSGGSPGALDLLQERAANAPGDVSAQLALASAYLASRRADRALEVLKGIPANAGEQSRYARLLVNAVAAQRGTDEALRELERLVTANPQDTALLNLAAGVYVGRGRIPEARQMLERIIAVNPKSPDAYIALAELDVTQGELARAQARLREAENVAPTSLTVRVARAKLAWRTGHRADTRRMLEEVHKADASLGPALLLARVYFADRDTKRADELLASIAGSAAGSAPTQSAVAEVLVDFGRYESALSYLKRAVELAPTVTANWLNLARTQIALEQWAPARDSLKRALEHDASSIPAASLLALLDLREGHKEQALSAATELRKRNPENAAAAMLEGDVRARLGQHAEAATAYAAASRLQPTLAAVVRETESRRLAGVASPEEPLSRWLQTHSDDRIGRTMLADTYLRSGRTPQAIAEYERLAAQGAATPAVLNNLAWLYQEAGDKRAEAVARRAHEADQKNPAIQDTLGWILVGVGKAEEGAEILKAAVAGAPKDSSIRYHYAVALEKVGRTAEAGQEVKQALGAGTAFPERNAAEQLAARLIR